MQIDADPDPVSDPAYNFDADPDADPGYQNEADPDPQHCCLLTITSVVDPDIELIGLNRSNQTSLSKYASRTGSDLCYTLGNSKFM